MALLIRRDPFRDLLDIERNVSRMLEDYGGSGEMEESIIMPSIDVMNRENDLVIHAEMPGLKPEDLDVSLSDNMLTIRGERSQEKETNEQDYVMRERSWGTFERTIQLPGHITAEQIEARYNDGVLEVVVHDGAQGRQPQRQQIPLQGQSGQQKQMGGLQQQGGQQQQSMPQGATQQSGQHTATQQGQQGSGVQPGQHESQREQLRENLRSQQPEGGSQQSTQGGSQQSTQGGSQLGSHEEGFSDKPSSKVGGSQSGIGNR